MELLETSNAARILLEQLRDELFTLPGLRWVLCGALGIVHGVVASPRLEGYLYSPIEIEGIKHDHAPDILESRIDAYAVKEDERPYLPLLPDDFYSLYQILAGNLRSVLSHADEYCMWVADRKAPESNQEKRNYFSHWLSETSEQVYEAAWRQLGPRAREVFQKAATLGLFSPSDFEQFGFNNIPAFRPHIRDLEETGLLRSTRDDGDKRRKTIQITPKGWLVHYQTILKRAK